MDLFIKPVSGKEDIVYKYYTKHGSFCNGDSGLDLFCLSDQTIPAKSYSNKIYLGICGEAYGADVFLANRTPTIPTKVYNNPVGYYLYPRSSTGSKTPLRLSNSVGIIDSGYRGELIALVDNLSDMPFYIKEGERYFQLCGPNLGPINLQLRDELSSTQRGSGGFGSTGN